MHQPFNLKLDELTTFNIEDRDRTIAQLRKELKACNTNLRDAHKVTTCYPYHYHTIKHHYQEIKTLKERLLKVTGERRAGRG
jgi:DNA gyrase/topoisomerase IV subunit A